MEKQNFNLTIFLIKDYVFNLDECLKETIHLIKVSINSAYGLDGFIAYCESKSKEPTWKTHLQSLATDKIDIGYNTSNKAIMLVRVGDRIVALAFGYGRSFLKEEHIERNFGFRVALNIINPQKMRSVSASAIEDMVVNTQRQASYSTSQDEFGLNISSDIMKGITGEPCDDIYGNHISGKDSLVVSVFMELMELKEKLVLYLAAYEKQRYKEIGFEWVDNIGEVRDSILKDQLDFKLADSIKSKDVLNLHAAPPETIDWERVVGFCFSGIREDTSKAESYDVNLDVSIYISKIKPDTNVYKKIKRDKIYAIMIDDTIFSVCSVYNALVYQTEYEGKRYILCSGNWYHINSSFYEHVFDFVDNKVPLSDLQLPTCPKGMCEGDYNELISKQNPDFFLLDKKMFSVESGPKKIEACDLFSKNKQLIHVKNRGKSAQLSHLFAQGKISAQCLISDETYRKQISDTIANYFGQPVFDYTSRPVSDEYEVIYVIINTGTSTVVNALPFFSLVNLMLATQELNRMHVRCSVLLVPKEI